MNYDLIRNFITVAKTQNITRTAEVLFISQSTVSHRLHLLEETLGHSLIYRGRGKRVATLTEHGRAFLPLAEKWLALWQETDNFRNEAPTQHLQVACVSSLSNCLLSDFFVDFSLKHPNIHLSVHVLSSEEIYARMNRGLLHVGIVLSELPLPNITISPLLSEKMLCVCSSGLYPEQESVTTSELDPFQEIFLNWGTNFQLWHDLHIPPTGEPAIETNDILFVKRALTKHAGWSIVPETVADRYLEQGICKALNLKNPPPDRISYVITPDSLTPSTANIISLFQAQLAKFIEEFNLCKVNKD